MVRGGDALVWAAICVAAAWPIHYGDGVYWENDA